ncbi:VOC family protein [Streptomyces smyrnaeus]|uniref:VOC family protein n=1 Tax=Streptomyces TaxID=1883 RepID=UPI000C1A0EBC|nr:MULTISPECIES: VOC family protein [unclassified Streptomyces]MBQ0862706.1 VOC family protein [Streptomyces sp. RK75]MBQ1119285.1 VOC family protein [Streptomyces sp. B15]MBQ1161009.1 VOC family protein [Streptomyces sp. A73]
MRHTHVPRGIDHVGVTVPDIEKATDFFARTLGAERLYDTLPRAEGPKGGQETTRRLGVPPGTAQVAMRMLRLPHGPGLELFEFHGPRQREAAVPSDLGWQHLACYVEDLPAACEAVREAGGSLLDEPHDLPGPEAGPRNRFVYCRTPWGSTLELLTYPDPMPYEHHTPLRRWRP